MKLRPLATLLVLPSALLLGSQAFADVGVLDKWDCHNHAQTGKYHCHGDPDNAKLGGFVLGGGVRSQAWGVGDNSLFLLAGAAVNAEYNYRSFAVTGSYFLQYLVTEADEGLATDETLSVQGFEIGGKAGPGVGRLGNKFYVTAGWSVAEVNNAASSSNSELSGYYIGVGTGVNTPSLAFDVAVVYQDPKAANDFISAEQNKEVQYDIGARVNIGARF